MIETTRVLYVDDNALDRALVRDALTRDAAGYELAEATTVEIFERALGAGPWSIVLTDINILGYSGLDVVDAVRRRSPELPVIVVTGTGSEEIAVAAMRRGVDDYIIKTPRHLRRLPQTIQAVLERRSLQQEKERADAEVHRLNSVLEGRVLERTAQLQEALEDLEAFNASVAHDLRAPLRAIDGYAALALADPDGKLTDDQRRSLGHVREAVNQMAQLIEALLNLARVSQRELRPEAVDLSALAERVMEKLQAGEPDRLAEVSVQPGLMSFGDEVLLRTVLDNLLSNAWKFTASQAVTRIEFVSRTDPAAGQVYVVRDNGAGFPADQADKLFMPFRRLHTDADFPGLGLGLATVRRIVRRHGGRVWAKSIPGRGAEFFFTLGQSAT